MTVATWMPNRPPAEVTENSHQRVALDSATPECHSWMTTAGSVGGRSAPRIDRLNVGVRQSPGAHHDTSFGGRLVRGLKRDVCLEPEARQQRACVDYLETPTRGLELVARDSVHERKHAEKNVHVLVLSISSELNTV